MLPDTTWWTYCCAIGLHSMVLTNSSSNSHNFVNRRAVEHWARDQGWADLMTPPWVVSIIFVPDYFASVLYLKLCFDGTTINELFSLSLSQVIINVVCYCDIIKHRPARSISSNLWIKHITQPTQLSSLLCNFSIILTSLHADCCN